MVSKTAFDKFSMQIRRRLVESQSYGVLTDDTQSLFYGVIRLPFWVQDVKTGEAFIVSRISKDALLGMLFLITHKLCMDFRRPILQVDGQDLTCTNWHGRLLLTNIQVAR